jgi:hypothetical protein
MSSFLSSKRYRYDSPSGQWILDNDPSVAENNFSMDPLQQTAYSQTKPVDQVKPIKQENDTEHRSMTREQIEEHGLVLAIQAAHHATLQQRQILPNTYINEKSKGGMEQNLGRKDLNSMVNLPIMSAYH